MNDTQTGAEVLAVKATLGEDTNQHLIFNSSDLNLADGLTKDSPEARKPMAIFQSRKSWTIHYDPEFKSARKKQQLQRKVRETKSKAEIQHFDIAEGDTSEDNDG